MVLTSLRPDAWKERLAAVGLEEKYLEVVAGLQFVFIIGLPTLLETHAPQNTPSLIAHIDTFHDSIRKELSLGHYLGPLSFAEVERALGPFQTSPPIHNPETAQAIILPPCTEFLVPARTVQLI